MTRHAPIDDAELHAFMDRELPPERAEAVRIALCNDPALAARLAAYQADQRQLQALFAPVAARPLPQAWRRRIATHRASRLAGRAWRMSIAAGLVFALLAGGRILLPHGRGSTLAEADAAHDGTLPTLRSLKIGALAQSATDAALAASLGMNIRAPDLARFGYRLAGVDFYRGPAAGLIYRNAQAATLTIYVRRSNGEARFDLLRRGKLRVCIWQDEVVSAVMEGDMSAGEMMRVASAAYSDLNL